MSQQQPDLALGNLIFQLRQTPSEQLKEKLSSSIKEKNLAPLYEYVVDEGLIPGDAAALSKMQKVNEERKKELEAAIEVANASEDEIQEFESWVALGNYYTELCDREQAVTTLRKALDMTASSGSKIDILLTICRIGFFFMDREFAGEQIGALKALVDKEGDWERKNRYKTYRGLHLLSIRQFSEATDLLIDSFATFTCTELMEYSQVVSLGIVCGALTLDRPQLKRKIIDSPEILGLVDAEIVPLTEMTNSLYTCEYKTLFKALLNVKEQFLDPFWALAPHASYYVREMRCKAYSQLLESYMALNIKSMADNFGVSVDFLDRDLGRMIPHKKLNCVVDKVNGVIVTNRPDSKNAQYKQIIKSGDALLTKLQKYSAAIRLYGDDELA